MITSGEPIPDRMLAAVLEAPGNLTVREIPVWPVDDYGDPDLMLIRVEACGVCGSDFRYFAGENPWAQHTLGKFMPNPPNIVLGHEYAGVVVAVQTEQNRHWLGKRVAPVCSKVCGKCPDCRAQREHLCPNTVHMGHGQGWGVRDYYPGAYAQYTLGWGALCYEIPSHVSFGEAAMMDILAVCVHVCRQAGEIRGKDILCIGAGPAGNGIAQAALALGARSATLLDRSESALETARRQGFGKVISQPPDDRFGAVFDTVGSVETFELALSVLDKRGSLVCVAVHDEVLPLNVMRLGAERRITTSCNFEPPDFELALRWLGDGKLRVKDWLLPIKLEQLPSRFSDAKAGKKVFKLLLEP